MQYDYLLTWYVLLQGAAGRPPIAIVAFLFCSHSSVSWIVRAYRPGSHGIQSDQEGWLACTQHSCGLGSPAPACQWLRLSLRGVGPHLWPRVQFTTVGRGRGQQSAASATWEVGCGNS